MDKKKLARLLAIIGGALMVVVIVLWFIPTMTYTYTDKAAGQVTTTISPMGYFAEGNATYGTFRKAVMDARDPDYNTNKDMYWLAFGTLFAVVGFILALVKGHKIAPKVICAIFAVFILCGVIFSPALHVSPIWALYLIVAILAAIASVGAVVVDYISD